jgi:hypothetical protein
MGLPSDANDPKDKSYGVSCLPSMRTAPDHLKLP